MDQERPVKLSDISKALNLSVSTVSRALKDSHEIGEETKKIVQSYASKVNYRPNLIAQSLKEMNTRYIAIIVPEISNSFLLKLSMALNLWQIARVTTWLSTKHTTPQRGK